MFCVCSCVCVCVWCVCVCCYAVIRIVARCLSIKKSHSQGSLQLGSLCQYKSIGCFFSQSLYCPPAKISSQIDSKSSSTPLHNKLHNLKIGKLKINYVYRLFESLIVIWAIVMLKVVQQFSFFHWKHFSLAAGCSCTAYTAMQHVNIKS